MLSLVGKTLAENEIENCFVKGNVWSRNAAIRKFKAGVGNTGNDNKVIIGKCGHMFHKDCMDSWLSRGNTICPIDKVTWEEYRIADNYTTLPIVNKKKHNYKYRHRYNKACKYYN